ncbi:MAG TPA: phospholipid carrier-dependent glycosyltransferase, partial [Candidatus Deferrimicrobium sp.]|nr:phospholipid carrier-dependent glycosyltransferase [Candidatus Deferrimicrobium sp.]
VILSAFIFYIYASFNQRYVGASDWYGYYQQAQLLKNGQVSLETKIPAIKYPAIAPLSFYSVNGKVLGQYPPGFPLLMATAGFAGLEFFVNPFLGVLSVILMFLTIYTLTGKDKWTAGLFALLWAFFPLTVYGSTYVMSDLPATFFILLAFYLLKIKKLIPSALSLAFCLAVRPSSVLFCVVFLPLVWQELKAKQRGLYGAWFAGATSLYAVYNRLVYGSPWRTGYMNISYNLATTIFTRNLQYYARETLVQFTPLLVLLALVSLWKKEKHALFLTAWFAVFFIFYCFWAPFMDSWWWLRFLLPGFPALFLLAALGFKRILMAIRLDDKILKHALPSLLVVTVLAAGIYFVYCGTHYPELWAKGKGKLYYLISKKATKNIMPGSLVGCCEFSGPLRIYANIETFGFFHLNSLFLISDMLKEGKPVYVMVEPWQKENPGLKWIFKNFKIKKITDVGMEAWSGFFLYRIMEQKYQELLMPPG